MRRHDIDNLRNLTILLLFPVHTFMVWNDFGSKFYIWQGENKLLSTLIVLVNPWFMPILFVLAGMSARYALEKRSMRGFLWERFYKLIIPFLCGMVFLVPFQTLFARKFFDGYGGGLFAHWKYSFTHVTDLSGYYVLSNDAVMEKLEKNIRGLACLCAAQTAATVWLYYNFAYYGDLWVCFMGWISILVLLVFGKKFLNKKTGFTAYFNRASYPIYILHQSILVALAYYVTRACDILAAQAFGICAGSFVLTIFAYHVIVKVPIARVMVGVRKTVK